MAEDIITGADGAVYINIGEGLKRVVNNAKLYAKLLNKFRTDNTNLLDDALNFFQAGDYEKAQVAAHTLKGIAANLSFAELYKQTIEMETQIKGKALNQDTQDSIKKCFAETLIHINEVIEQYGG